jgi:hypothetical protein
MEDSTNVYSVSDGRTTSAGSQFGTVLYGNLQYYNLFLDNFAIATFSASQASYGWYYGSITLRSFAFDETNAMIPKVFSYSMGFIFISTNILSFSRTNIDNLFTNQTFEGLSLESKS